MILEILQNQIAFVEALCIGVIAHTIAGAVKHRNDFNFKALLTGAIEFALKLVSILLVIVGIYMYEPLIKKFAEEMETLKIAIVFLVYGKSILLIKDHWTVKDEDMEEAKKYIDTRNYGEVNEGK